MENPEVVEPDDVYADSLLHDEHYERLFLISQGHLELFHESTEELLTIAKGPE